jgi:hypothetical protein
MSTSTASPIRTVIGGLVETVYGVDATDRPLEDITAPLTAASSPDPA